jgi:hypothetical protein
MHDANSADCLLKTFAHIRIKRLDCSSDYFLRDSYVWRANPIEFGRPLLRSYFTASCHIFDNWSYLLQYGI